MKIEFVKAKTSNKGKIVTGIIFIGLGIILILKALGKIDSSLWYIIRSYWPMIIIFSGINKIFKALFEDYKLGHRFNNIIKGGEVEKSVKKEIRALRLGGVIRGFFVLILGAVLLENRIDLFLDERIKIFPILFSFLLIYIGYKVIFGNSNIYYHKMKRDDFNSYKSSGFKGHNKSKQYDGFEDFEDVDYEEIEEDSKKKNSEDKFFFKSEGSRSKEFSYQSVGNIRIGDKPFVLSDNRIKVGIGEIYINLNKALIEEGETFLLLKNYTGSIVVIVPEDLAVDIVAKIKIGECRVFKEEILVDEGNSKEGFDEVDSNQIIYRSENYNDAIKKVNIRAYASIGSIDIKKL